ncbi:MAG TPA: DUF421 domain-containing protein [Bacillota bacterium]|nr:DUF421 domain-containing protein [Bacillota bacterium]
MSGLHPFWRVIISSTEVFLVLTLLSRLMGRKLVSQMTTFDFAAAITIGAISGVYAVSGTKGYYILLSLVIFAVLVILSGFLTLNSVPARKLLVGEPVVMIENGKIQEHNMAKVRYNSDNLLTQLREKGIFELSEVEYAILETNGELSVLKKSQSLPVTPKDLHLSTAYHGIPALLVREGHILSENLARNKLTHEWLYNQLAAHNIRDLNTVFLASLSTDGTLFTDLREDPNP